MLLEVTIYSLRGLERLGEERCVGHFTACPRTDRDGPRGGYRYTQYSYYPTITRSSSSGGRACSTKSGLAHAKYLDRFLNSATGILTYSSSSTS